MNEHNLSDAENRKRLNRQRKAGVADDGQPAMPAPEEVVEELRALSQRLGEAKTLTPKQRQAYRDLVRLTHHTLNTSISMIDSSENVSQAVGQPTGEVRRKVDVSDRWTAVEDELRVMLTRVSDANLIRRYEIALIAAQAYGVGKQLARAQENAGLRTHLQEIKRLKGIGRRKKASQDSEESPEPAADLPVDPHG